MADLGSDVKFESPVVLVQGNKRKEKHQQKRLEHQQDTLNLSSSKKILLISD